ncbi:MAG TPA: hypothetical protein VF514_15520, partial [Bacteroidota bacterium]
MDSTASTLWRASEFSGAKSRYAEGPGYVPESNQGYDGFQDPSTERCIRSYGPAIKRYAVRY